MRASRSPVQTATRMRETHFWPIEIRQRQMVHNGPCPFGVGKLGVKRPAGNEWTRKNLEPTQGVKVHRNWQQSTATAIVLVGLTGAGEMVKKPRLARILCSKRNVPKSAHHSKRALLHWVRPSNHPETPQVWISQYYHVAFQDKKMETYKECWSCDHRD